MTGYTPEQMPVVSGLARGFATFDHWFCEVPSQTFTNRSFFHAGDGVGVRRQHHPAGVLPASQHRGDDLRPAGGARADLAGLLRPAGARVVHRADPRRPAQGPLRARTSSRRPVPGGCRQRAPARLTRSSSRACCTAITTCTRPRTPCSPAWPVDLPSSLLGGEALLARVYDAVRSSSSATGSNVYNTPAHDQLRRARRHLRPRPAAPGPVPGPVRSRRPVRVHLRPLRHPGPGDRHLAVDPGKDRSSTTSTATPR